MSVNADRFRGQRIVDRDNATRTFELRCRGNTIINVWRSEERTGLLRGEFSLRHEWRANSVLPHVILHIGAFEIEFIGWNQVVERHVPLRARIALPRESKFAIRPDAHRLGPRIQFRVADDGENTCDGKIVIAPCFRVRRVAIELAQGVSRGGYERAERGGWLLLFLGQP